MCLVYIGASPSGKAQDFDSCMRRFESFRPSHDVETVQVQSADWVGEVSEVGISYAIQVLLKNVTA